MSIASQPLATQIQDAVIHSPHLNLRRMKIKTEMGRVTLNGTVHSYFEKQMAQETLRKIEGIESIENQLQVTWNQAAQPEIGNE